MLPAVRHRIVEMWNSATQSYETDTRAIGNIIRSAGLARSGAPRGDGTKGQRILDSWSVDFSSCRTHVTETEVMQLLLGIKAGKRPGTNGVCGEAYKLAAVALAPVFIESFTQLKSTAFDYDSVPAHVCETLWIPAAKRQDAKTIDAVRDLECPNEDTKVLERIIALLVDETTASDVRKHNEAFVKGGDITVNLYTMHEAFQRSLSKRELHLLLLLDCAKGFNLMSHQWVTRVLEHARLPSALLLSISRLIFKQIAFLLFSGIVLESVTFLCGLRQGGPLSGYMFIICCACLLESISLAANVLFVKGFCDDFQSLVRGIRAVRAVLSKVKEFEAASGLAIHRTKSKFIPNRIMTQSEKRSLQSIWSDANIVDRTVSLGMPIGRGVPSSEASERGMYNARVRIDTLSKISMSWTMRVMSVNMFVLSLTSFSNRLFLMSPHRINEISNRALRFVTPMPFCSFRVLSHCSKLFRVSCALRDPLFDNIASVLSTAYTLQRRGVIDDNVVSTMRDQIAEVCSDDIVPVSGLIDQTQPLLHFVIAAGLFQKITGTTPDAFLQNLRHSQLRNNKLHKQFYDCMLRSAAEDSRALLRDRIGGTGSAWDSLITNLDKIPSSIPRGHCVSYFKYLLNGLMTSARRRFVDGVVVVCCPYCGIDGGDDRAHWVCCPVLRRLFAELYGGTTSFDITHEHFHLQIPVDGREIQLLFAFVHAVWRGRCAIVNGYFFNNYEDLSRHFRSIIDDPWIHGHPVGLSRIERRTLRSRAPEMHHNTFVYFFDGASRSRNGANEASYGALMRINGMTMSRSAVYLGDSTNNEAEYQGVLAVLEHALSSGFTKIHIFGDSKLVVQQLNGIWKCKASNLFSSYEKGLDMVRRLREVCASGSFVLAHVYREFNVDADGLANVAIDRRVPPDVVVIDDHWSFFQIDAVRFVDGEGDVIIP